MDQIARVGLSQGVPLANTNQDLDEVCELAVDVDGHTGLGIEGAYYAV